MNVPSALIPQLQALLAHWDEMAESATRKVNASKEPTAGAFYTGVLFGFEDCADSLARVLSAALTESTQGSQS